MPWSDLLGSLVPLSGTSIAEIRFVPLHEFVAQRGVWPESKPKTPSYPCRAIIGVRHFQEGRIISPLYGTGDVHRYGYMTVSRNQRERSTFLRGPGLRERSQDPRRLCAAMMRCSASWTIMFRRTVIVLFAHEVAPADLANRVRAGNDRHARIGSVPCRLPKRASPVPWMPNASAGTCLRNAERVGAIVAPSGVSSHDPEQVWRGNEKRNVRGRGSIQEREGGGGGCGRHEQLSPGLGPARTCRTSPGKKSSPEQLSPGVGKRPLE